MHKCDSCIYNGRYNKDCELTDYALEKIADKLGNEITIKKFKGMGLTNCEVLNEGNNCNLHLARVGWSWPEESRGVRVFS